MDTKQPDPIQQFIDATVALGSARARGEISHADVLALINGAAVTMKVTSGQMIEECTRVVTSSVRGPLDERIEQAFSPVGRAVRVQLRAERLQREPDTCTCVACSLRRSLFGADGPTAGEVGHA
jgi:hypothetical protein